MSIQAIIWARNQRIVTGAAEQAVLFVVASYTDSQGRHCLASVATIAADARLNERTARRALRCLEEIGVLEREGRAPGRADRATWIYRIRAGLMPPREIREGAQLPLVTVHGGAQSPSRGGNTPPNPKRSEELRAAVGGVPGPPAAAESRKSFVEEFTERFGRPPTTRSTGA